VSTPSLARESRGAEARSYIASAVWPDIGHPQERSCS
jgi:hypothetical protein